MRVSNKNVGYNFQVGMTLENIQTKKMTYHSEKEKRTPTLVTVAQAYNFQNTVSK